MNSVHSFFHAVSVFTDHLAEVSVVPLLISLAFHSINLLLRSAAWHTIVRAAYPDIRYRWRSSAGAYFAGVGVNAIAPARGGDLVKIYLVRSRIVGSTTPTLLATLVCETLVDAVIGTVMLGFALHEHVLPAVPDLPKLPAFEWSWMVDHPVSALILAALVAAGVSILQARAMRFGRRLRDRFAQGFAVMHAPKTYVAAVVLPQLAGWCCRIAAAWYSLEAFGITPSLRTAVLVLVVGSLSTLLPFTPGGVGTQQALIVVVLGSVASDASLISFSVGAQATVMVTNALVGLAALALMARTLRTRGLLARLHLEHGA